MHEGQKQFEVAAGSELPKELGDLAQGLLECTEDQPLSRTARLGSAFGRVVEMVNRRRRILNLVQEALSQLRLDVKYLMFDLEVTRRERDELRSRLEEIERGY